MNHLLPIGKAAAFLGVSIDTLRRWDKNGKLPAIRKPDSKHRYYSKRDLELFQSNLLQLASDWASSGRQIPNEFYCSNSAIFQAQLNQLQDELARLERVKDFFSLIVAVAGEIGNNSFDHNLGNWPDTPGVFFGYDVNKGEIVLADRGQGVRQTLQRVKPELTNHQAALRVAFTEIISGRAPEERGNGLKFVRSVIARHPLNLLFQSGDAEFRMKGQTPDFQITQSPRLIRGCLAHLIF